MIDALITKPNKSPSKPDSSLNPRQARFVAEYLLDLKATAAYGRAGYAGSCKSAESAACRLLRNIRVSAAISEAMEKRANDLGIDAKYVLSTIKETIDRCRQVHPVLDRKGEQVFVQVGEDGVELVPAFTFDASGVLKGAELLGRHLKMFTDKTEFGAVNGGPLEVQVTYHEP
jgi:phage terminase small subunit